MLARGGDIPGRFSYTATFVFSRVVMSNIVLTPEEARILGSLMEKSVVTPEQYPLTLNALTLACNQKIES